jgi:hypothetical protein
MALWRRWHCVRPESTLKLRPNALGRKLLKQRAGGDYKAAVRRWL